jgi:hypothetical protein
MITRSSNVAGELTVTSRRQAATCRAKGAQHSATFACLVERVEQCGNAAGRRARIAASARKDMQQHAQKEECNSLKFSGKQFLTKGSAAGVILQSLPYDEVDVGRPDLRNAV